MKKIIGIILLVFAVLAIIGSFANGSFASLGDHNIFYLIGYFAGFAALIIGGIALIKSSKK